MFKKLILLTVLICSAGCTTNGVYDSGKTWMLVGALAIGGIAASQQSDSPAAAEPNCFLHINSNGSSSTVCR